jgi:hypothetical protein
LFESYDAYLDKMRKVARELKRVVAKGRIVCIARLNLAQSKQFDRRGV